MKTFQTDLVFTGMIMTKHPLIRVSATAWVETLTLSFSLKTTIMCLCNTGILKSGLRSYFITLNIYIFIYIYICWCEGVNEHNLHSIWLPSASTQTPTHSHTVTHAHTHTAHKRGVLHAVGFPWPCAQQCVEAPPRWHLARWQTNITAAAAGGGGEGGRERGVRHTGTPPLVPCDLKRSCNGAARDTVLITLLCFCCGGECLHVHTHRRTRAV